MVLTAGGATTNIVENLLSWHWWVGVVVVGILIHLIASYVKPRVDRGLGAMSSVFGAFSARRAARNAAREQARTARVERLRGNPQAQMMVAIEELRCRTRALSAFMGGVGMLLLGTVFERLPPMLPGHISIAFLKFATMVMFLLGTITLMLAMRLDTDSDRLRRELRDALGGKELGSADE